MIHSQCRLLFFLGAWSKIAYIYFLLKFYMFFFLVRSCHLHYKQCNSPTNISVEDL